MDSGSQPGPEERQGRDLENAAETRKDWRKRRKACPGLVINKLKIIKIRNELARLHWLYLERVKQWPSDIYWNLVCASHPVLR